MQNKIKLPKEELNNIIEEYKNDINLNNHFINDKVIINLDLSNGEIYQNFSGDSLINQEIFDYVENILKYINKKDDFVIQIKFPESYKDEEKNKVIKLMKSHYAVEIIEVTKEIRKNNILTIILLIVGTLFFIVNEIVSYNHGNIIFLSILEIFAWVFIWEACYLYFFTNNSFRINRLKYIKIFKSIDK